jgi:hypothetical protein
MFNWKGFEFMTANHFMYGISIEFLNVGMEWWQPNQLVDFRTIIEIVAQYLGELMSLLPLIHIYV